MGEKKRILVKGVEKRTMKAKVNTTRMAITCIKTMAAGIVGRMKARRTATIITTVQLYISLVQKEYIKLK
jgi:hypothetical protein